MKIKALLYTLLIILGISLFMAFGLFFRDEFAYFIISILFILISYGIYLVVLETLYLKDDKNHTHK